MATDSVTREVALAKDLVQKTNIHAGNIASGLQALSTSFGIAVPDPTPVLAALASMLDKAADAATASQAQHGVQKGATQAPLAARDTAATKLRAGLRDGYNALVSRYGKDQVAAAFPAGDTPRVPQALVTYATTAITGIQRNASGSKDRSDAVVVVGVDPMALAAALGQLRDALSNAVQALTVASTGVTATGTARDDTQQTLHALHKGLLHTVTGLMEAVGMEAEADALVQHHHLSHPKSPQDPPKPVSA